MFQINWKLKAFIYKIFDLLKLKITYYFIQKHITKRSLINIEQISKLWLFHSESIKKNNIKNIIEVGAGKSLEQNIYISYVFNNSIAQTTIDIKKMIDFNLANQASEKISKILNLNNKGRIENFDQLRKLYNINYVVPSSLKNFKDSNKKFDMCISTNTLEHFTISDLNEYLIDLKSVLKTNGLVSSVIDYSDHYSHTDKNITSLNFLRYSNKEWNKYNNSYLFQNRLRHQDYIEKFNINGYKIKKIYSGSSATPPLKISDEFNINNKDTFIEWAYFLMEQ